VVDLVAGLEWDMVLGLRMGLGLETDLDLETGLVMRNLDVQMGAAMVMEGVTMKKNRIFNIIKLWLILKNKKS
jgi:hypothetical protein